MKLDQAASDGEADSKPPFAATSGPGEKAENAGEVRGRNPLAAVGHAKHNTVRFDLCPHVNLAVWRCVLRGIRQHVEKYLLQADRVGVEPCGRL